MVFLPMICPVRFCISWLLLSSVSFLWPLLARSWSILFQLPAEKDLYKELTVHKNKKKRIPVMKWCRWMVLKSLQKKDWFELNAIHNLQKKKKSNPPITQQHSFDDFFQENIYIMEGKKFYLIHSDVLNIHISIRMAWYKCHAIYCIFVYSFLS